MQHISGSPDRGPLARAGTRSAPSDVVDDDGVDVPRDEVGSVGPGDVLDGRYRLVRRLGAGGMATIFLARDQSLDRDVAVKVLHGHLADDDSVLRRFRTEARHAAALLHPHIVNVYDQGFDRLPYIVMEHVDGPSLRQVLHTRGRLRPPEALAVIGPVASALSRAHAAGVVHRDIKPENVLVTSEGVAKVVDFGIARALSGTHHTQTGTLIGSVHYLAPELVAGEEATPASDQYALGVLLFELLTGRKALPAESPMAVALRHGREPIPPPSDFVSDSSEELDEVVARATAADPDERYRGVDELMVALTEAVPGDPEPIVVPDGDEEHTLVVPMVAPSPSVSTGEHSMPTVGTTARRHRAEAPTRRWPRRLAKALLVLIVVSGLAAGAAYAWWLSAVAPLRDVPVLTELTEDEAVAELTRLDLVVGDVDRPHDRTVPEGVVMDQDPGPGAEAREGDAVDLVVSAGPAFVEMPRVLGMTEEEAIELLEGEPYFFSVAEPQRSHHDTAPAGTVIGQAPDGGQELRQDREVLIHISLGIEQVVVPDLEGLTRAEAEAALAEAELQVEFTEEYSDEVPTAGTVVSQSVAPEEEIDKGSVVEVVVSRGPLTIAVPNVEGQSVEAATAELRGLGLQVRVFKQPRPQIGPFRRGEFDRVEAQSPQGGTQVQRGERIDLYTFAPDEEVD